MLEREGKNSCLKSSRSLVEEDEEVGGVVVEGLVARE